MLVVAACGGGGGATPIGGTHAFDVTATLTVTPRGTEGGYWPDFPLTQKLTLVWNADTHLVFVGAHGVVDAEQEISVAVTAHGTTSTFALPVPFDPGCNRKGNVTYDQLHFTVTDTGGALQGTARGSAQYVIGDQVFTAEMTATLTGVADGTPPTFSVPAGEVDPLAPPSFLPSEPLPRSATASLLGAASGDVVALLPGTVQGAGNGDVVTAFSVAGTALRAGETYSMKVDGVADFAGHMPAVAPMFTTRAAPPLAPEDGFEGVAMPTLGGAGVLRGGPLTPIAGATSLILNTGVGGGFGFLPYMLGPSLTVRLVVSPGDTVVRFQRSIVATALLQSARFYGTLRVASPGGAIGLGPPLEATDLVKVTLPVDGDVFVSSVRTVEVPLPAGAQGEVTFEIVGETAGCGVPPPSTALIIDDLRVE